jgi:galactose mutarotase-like enzyme
MDITISNSILTAKINMKGAELVSLIKNETKINYLWNIDTKYWNKHSPVLFPIVGILKNNSFTFEGNDYKLSRHGFARDMEFEIAEKNENFVTFKLVSNSETMKIYPFAFEFFINYSFVENQLKIEFIIVNKNESKMPFSIGAHPAFAINSEFEKYNLSFEINENLERFELENDLLSEKTKTIKLKDKILPLKYSLFEKDALVFKTLQSRKISLNEENKKILTIHFSDFKNLGIWTKINAPFLCIEPWLGYSDSDTSTGNLFEKEAIQILNPNSEKSYSYLIEIH